MKTNPELSPAANAEQRRWLIGLLISVSFGLFGVVMALLIYAGRSKAPPTVVAPRAEARSNNDAERSTRRPRADHARP